MTLTHDPKTPRKMWLCGRCDVMGVEAACWCCGDGGAIVWGNPPLLDRGVSHVDLSE